MTADHTQEGQREVIARALWLADDYDLDADPTGSTARELLPEYLARADAVLSALRADHTPERLSAADLAALADWWESDWPDEKTTAVEFLAATVERILAAHLADAEAEKQHLTEQRDSAMRGWDRSRRHLADAEARLAEVEALINEAGVRHLQPLNWRARVLAALHPTPDDPA